jgi:hypothetical protein
MDPQHLSSVEVVLKPPSLKILFNAVIIAATNHLSTESDLKMSQNKQPIDTWWTL